jgi:signal transduction histidine kinase
VPRVFPAPQPHAPRHPEPLPGARRSCALLTVLTVLLAWPDPPPLLGAIVRPAYFGLLALFFWRLPRQSPELEGQSMRLLRSGFLVLCLSSWLGAVLQLSGLTSQHAAFAYLREVCDRGALVLLGTTLLSYGLMLWIPQVLRSHQLLAAHAARQKTLLGDAQDARSRLEQRLVDADRRGILGELAASIAHDLRNPLTIVAGAADSLCRRPRSHDEVTEHTQVIRRNIDKANHTIQSLIDLARPRAEAAAAVAVDALLRELVELLQLEARRHEVALAVLDQGSIPDLHSDRALLLQALLNLVLNAIQASPPGTTVQLSARFWPSRRGDRIALAIADRGSGLPMSVRNRLFEPFFTTKPAGTGLGLTSCRRIAIELGGELRLFPRLAGGARALLWLPLRGDSVAAVPAADEARRWPAPSC